MRKYIFLVLSFLSGLGSGSLITWKVLKKKYDDKANEEIEAYQAAHPVAKPQPKPVVTTEITPDVFSDDYAKAINALSHDYMKEVERYSYYAVKDELADVARTYKDEDLSKHVAERTGPEEEDPSEFHFPRIISEEQFLTENAHYDKSTLTYYTEDDILCDEREDIIVDVDRIVGGDALFSFGVSSSDPDIVYVRNDDLGSDFEIVRQYQAYQNR